MTTTESIQVAAIVVEQGEVAIQNTADFQVAIIEVQSGSVSVVSEAPIAITSIEVKEGSFSGGTTNIYTDASGGSGEHLLNLIVGEDADEGDVSDVVVHNSEAQEEVETTLAPPSTGGIVLDLNKLSFESEQESEAASTESIPTTPSSTTTTKLCTSNTLGSLVIGPGGIVVIGGCN